MSLATMRIIHWMYGNNTRDKVKNENLANVEVASIDEKMRENNLQWFDHVQHTYTCTSQ